MNMTGGAGRSALIGGPVSLGEALARHLPDFQVVGVDASLASWPAPSRCSRMVARPGLPFKSAAFSGTAVDGRLGRAMVEEALRVTAPGSRVVVTETDRELGTWLAGRREKLLLEGRVTAMEAG